MNDNKEQDKQWASERYLARKSPSSIYASMGHSKSWFYKWMERYRAGEGFWFKDRARCPLQNPNRTPVEIVEIIKAIRLELYNKDVFCGAEAIRWELEDLGIEPLPSERTIARVFARDGRGTTNPRERSIRHGRFWLFVSYVFSQPVLTDNQ